MSYFIEFMLDHAFDAIEEVNEDIDYNQSVLKTCTELMANIEYTEGYCARLDAQLQASSQR